jgi:tetratricopeptide (TPR) repeat protein
VEIGQAIDKALELHREGKLEESKDIYIKILQKEPNNFEALHFLGVIAHQCKDHQLAIDLISKSIEIMPKNPVALSNLGNALKELNRFDEAIFKFDQAIALNSLSISAIFNRGLVLIRVKKLDQALQSFNAVIKIDSSSIEAFYSRALVLRDLGNWTEAIHSLDSAISLKPDYAEAYFERGALFVNLKQFDLAMESYDKAINLKENYFEAIHNRGFLFMEMGKLTLAIENLDKAINLQRTNAEAHKNKALALLVNGQFEEGFELYEWRWRSPKFGGLARSSPGSLWLGSQSLSEKTILLQAEQGIGDVIQFCRYVESVSDLGAHVLLEAPRKLVNLLKSLNGSYEVVAIDDALPHFDYRCPLMSLPRALKTTLHNIPLSQGYLRADQKRVSQIQEELRLKNPHSKRLCGISWLSKADKTGLFRSIHLKDFIGLLDNDDLLYVNLQYGEVDEEIAQVEKDLGVTVVNLKSVNMYDDIDGLAAIIEVCDLIISIDNTTVHLAGALGKDTRVLLPYVPEWRWMLDRKDSPWYESLKLYRQQDVFDWGSAFAQLKEDL